MPKFLADNGDDFIVAQLDRSTLGVETTVLKVDGNTGVATVNGQPIQSTAAGSVGASQLAAGAVTPSKTAALLRYYFGAGSNGAGHVTLAGAAVGDLVVAAIDLTTPADVTTDFESAVSVAGQIQQTTGNLSAKNLVIILQRQS